MNDLATHYGCNVLPARVRKPKDKALVEDAVHKGYNRIYAPLRNRMFHSLEELNKAVRELVDKYNSKRMQGCDYSRVERFIAAEKPALLPLPRQAFRMKRHAQLKVAPNSFIQLGQERHHYSVPCRLIGMQVEVVFTSTLVRIYHDGECVATHPRSLRTGAYTYVKEHLPSQSQAYYDYGPQRFIARGASYGRIVELVMRELFSSTDKPAELYYRSAQGILALARETEPEIFLLACDKYDLYQDFIVDNPYPARTLNEDIQRWMKPDELQHFVFSKQILHPLVEQGVKDVYLFNDTHWSPASSRLVAREVADKLI